MSVKNLLENIDHDTFKVVLEHAVPKDAFLGKKAKDITEWPYCDVMKVMESEDPAEMIEVALGISPEETLGAPQPEFVAFLKHLINEREKIVKLEERLSKEPDDDLVKAGISKLNMFGVTSIYYAINPDPREWDSISKIEYHKMWTRLMLDKVNAEIQKDYDKIITDRIKKQK